MSLDAFVYCDCFEKGRLTTPPPIGIELRIDEESGAVITAEENLPMETYLAFDEWCARACAHERGMLVHHFIGNIALVGLLRSELQRAPELFPITLTKVVQNGMHCGDGIPAGLIPELQRELDLLGKFRASSTEAEEFLADFRQKMTELASVALSVGKPIAF